MAYPMTPPDPTAVVGRRIVAFLIDLALVSLLSLAVVVPTVMGSMQTASEGAVDCPSANSSTSFDDVRNPNQENPSFCFSTGDGEVRYLPVSEENRVSVLFYGSALIVGLLNSVLLQGLKGASLGKLALGLRVVGKDGRRANVGRNLLRWVLLLLGTILCCIGWIIDLVMVFTTKGHRRVGDFAAGTFVVAKANEGTPPQVPGVTAMVPPGYPQPGAQGNYGAQPAWTPPPSGAPPVIPPVVPPVAPQQPPVDPTMSSSDGPTWDEARDAYIQYDPELTEWVQWDTQQNRWRSIDQ